MATARKSNPFRAGFGVDPPYFAGRHKEIRVIEEALDEIQGEAGQMAESPFPAMVLAGPRGVGKTVLLGHAKTAAGMRGIHTAKISCRLLCGTPERLVNKMFPKGLLKKVFGNLDHISFKYMEAGMSIGLREAESDLESAVQAFLSRKPLLLVLDEAHSCKPEALNLLFEVVQECMTAKMPLAAIVAGTPGLEPLMSRCDASYVERSRFLKFNTLTPDQAREALEKPTLEGGRPMDSDALELLLDWSDNYPYFLQLSGSLAWEASVISGNERITIKNAREGLSEADQERVSFYRKRYLEIDRKDLEEFAFQLIGIMRGDDGKKFDTSSLARRLMEKNEGMDKQSALKAVEDLMEEGYIWDSGDQILPGVPSLFDFVERKMSVD